MQKLDIYYILFTVIVLGSSTLFIALYVRNKKRESLRGKTELKIKHGDFDLLSEVKIEHNKEDLLSAFTKIKDKENLESEIKYLLLSYDFSTSFVEEVTRDKIDSNLTPEQIVKLIKGRISKKINLAPRKGITVHPTGGILMIGINGAGKTLTTVKFGVFLRNSGKKIVIAPADTYRAAAIEQLTTLSKRNGFDIVESKRGQDPASVSYVAMQEVVGKKFDYAIIDTSGRLDNNVNLINQLKKIKDTVEKKFTLAEVIYVYDCRTGLSGIEQVKNFNSSIGIDSIVLTKLDAVVRPGVVLELMYRTSLPIAYASDGEKIEHFHNFEFEKFLSAF